MGCVVLPSETARLVYGYLVKENLNDIALLFLEQSPYLMDCCQIVKSGYQFNTKLIGKNLQELLQEYSLIHNLVNKKVSNLCKTSLLYKRIKLRCENLPEILELILFWKYKNCKSEESLQSEKSEKNINNQEINTNHENLSSNEILQNKSIIPSDSSFIEEPSSVPKSKCLSESYSVSGEPDENYQNETSKEVSVDSDKKNDKEPVCMTVDMNHLVGAEDVNVNVNVNVSHSNENNGTSGSGDLNLNGNILTIDVNSQCEDLVSGGITPGTLTSLDERSGFENQIKIVGVQEEEQSENHPLNMFTKSLVQEEGNMNLENSSVVFVGSEIGNVGLGSEENQIIVIPIDYYKSQEELQSGTMTEGEKGVGQQKNDVIFAEEASDAAPAAVADSLMQAEEAKKTPGVDENIMTESDFLNNQSLVYNLEKEYEKATATPPVPKETEPLPVQPIPTQQVIVLSQTLPTRTTRYRTILPKKEPSVKIRSIVVQPLLESVKGSKTNVPERKRRDKCGNVKKKTGKKVEKKTESEGKEADAGKKEEKKDEERRNEEKENVKAEMKKTETPVFVRKKNSKRLSLSTPRRRSHIRALEFETPPKINEEKKKSRTSPKRVEHVNVERKCVRNTLFKSPTPEDSRTKIGKPPDLEPLNELSIPIATRSPNTKLSDAWENLTGVGCVIGLEPVKSSKKMWDADLRCFISQTNSSAEPVEKKKRKPERNQKDNRKSNKKKIISSKRIKPITISPSKISLTAKRNTYSINGNEEGSPIRSIDDLKLVTPFKDMEAIRPTEETPLTKLLRENINTIDIDLSMINTPSFPPTPSIVITPDLDDVAVPGTNYYSPVKDCTAKDKLVKITDCFRIEDKNNKKQMHDREIDDLVSKAKEIIGLGKEQEEPMKRRPSGKILSMVKIQMLTQCDKKLMENIPINEHFEDYASSLTNQTPTPDLKEELEEKRKRALKKIKVVKENLRHRNRVMRGRKRTRSGNASKSDKSNESVKKGMVHSTPYSKGDPSKFEKTDSDIKINPEVVEDIRQRLPPFQDSDKYPELNEKSRKKLHYVESFLKLPEVECYIKDNADAPAKLFLKPSLRRFFQVFYKWLRHPHKREVNASPQTKAVMEEYLCVFEKINKGLNQRCKKLNKSEGLEGSACVESDISRNVAGGKALSDEEEREWKKGGEKRKEEEGDDGVVSTLPLKKRKSTVVQQVETPKAVPSERAESKACGAENVSQTQNFLQDIDVDRFLSQIHGQENR